MSFPGSRRQVQQLVDDYYASLYRYAYRLTGSNADAEDLTQDTFCQAQMKLHQLRDASRTRAWLFRILRNAYLHRLRAQKHEQTLPLDWVGEVPERSSGPLPDVDPEQLQRALDELPEDFRTPLILFYFEEFSYRDIAEQMDLPLGTVMSRLARAKAHLRARLLPPPAAALAKDYGRANDGL
jgi:RNA polymerase sigma-70 factor (ECF subfamily)